jgi:AraC-like DNA-binding protein
MMIQFSTDALDPKDKFPFWCDLIGGSFNETNLSLDRDQRLNFNGSLSMRRFDDFEILESQSTAHVTTQTKKSLSHVDDEYVWVYRQMQSHEVVTIDGLGNVNLRPGDVYLYHSVQPSYLIPISGDDSRTQIFRFNKRHITAIGGPKAGYLPTRKLSGDAGAGRLLQSYVESLADELPKLSDFAADAALAAFYGLAAAAYGAADGEGEPISSAVVAGRVTLAKKLIGKQSRDPSLSAAAVAHAMHVSERTLHRAFELSGESFSAVLMQARLEACKRSLRDPLGTGYLIATIAFANGFDSLATFNRQFRGAYGMSPSEWRQMRREWR